MPSPPHAHSPHLLLSFVVLVGALSATAPADAQQQRIDRALFVGGQGLAWPRGALALGVNPAGLGAATALELHARTTLGGSAVAGDRGAGWGAWTGLPLGPLALAASVEQAADPAPAVTGTPELSDISRVSVGAGLRLDGWLDVGLAYRVHYGQSSQVGRLGTVDFGLLLSPWSWLSVGVRVSDVLGASSYALPEDTGALLGPHYAWGWAVKLRDEALIWTLDFEWPGSEALATIRGTAQVRLGEAWRTGVEYLVYREPSAIGVNGSTHTRLGLTLSYLPSWWGVDATVTRDRLPDEDAAGLLAVGVTLRHEPAFSAWQHLVAMVNGRAIDPAGARFGRQLLRQRVGWSSPLGGGSAERASALARVVLAWNQALAAEDGEKLCGALASGQVRFDIETHDPKLVIHRSFGREEACTSFVRGELRAYVFEFGPSRVHREVALLLPNLFRIHGSAYFRLPPAQEEAYVDHLRRLRRGKEPLDCTTYQANPLRLVATEGADAQSAQRVYEVAVGCNAIRSYVLQVEGNVTAGFKIRKMSLAR